MSTHTHFRRDEDRLAAIVQSSSDAIYAKRMDGTIVAWNASAVRLFGYTQDEALGSSARILVLPGDEEESASTLARISSGESVDRKETTLRCKDGSHVLLSVSRSPLHDGQGRVVGVSVIARDVSEQRRAEAASRQSEAEFRLLAEAMPQLVWMTGPDGSNTYCNQQWVDYTGLSLEESRGTGWNKAMHPDDQPRAWIAWQQAMKTGGIHSVECRMRRADGAYRWWLIRGVPMRAGANVVKWCGTCTDIHDLKLAQLAISESEERFARIFQTKLVAIGITETATGRFIDVNNHCAELFGYSRDEIIGRTALELGLWADPAERARLIANTSPGPPTSSAEIAFRRKSGEIRHALVSMEAITLAGIAEPLNLVVLVDLAERKQLELQLLQAQKMEAVGRLAGGVAHDFNNSLGVILGYTELLLRQASDAQRGKLEQILKATTRAAGLTRQLLAFSRKQIVDPRVLDLNALLSDVEKMLGRLIGEDVDLAIVPGAALGQVKVDPGQLEQVVMNLCVNARDAMPNGGLLRIETTNTELDAGHTTQHEPIAAGRYVMLAVSDTGSGIEKEILSTIFEPFFTTKEEGKGTGLGLAMVYGIVKQAGGHVSVYSEVGQGTTFKIYLPRVDEPLAAELEEAPIPSRGSETILLVEDEPQLRDIAREILEEHGYRVIAAGGGTEAVEMARRAVPIHLLLTDVVMPGMNGRALAESLRVARPELKVLYMSGYTDDVIAHRGVLEPGTLLIAKPFTARALLGRVREALGEPDAGVEA